MGNENCAVRTLPKGYLRTGVGEQGSAVVRCEPEARPSIYLWARRGSRQNRQPRTGCIL